MELLSNIWSAIMHNFPFSAAAFVTVAMVAVRAIFDARDTKRASTKLESVEFRIFGNAFEKSKPGSSPNVGASEGGGTSGEGEMGSVSGDIDAEQVRHASSQINSIGLVNLLDLYTKQIEKYQSETRSRANTSFSSAIIAMFVGLGFLIWGSSLLIKADQATQIAAGSLTAAIGGAVSAYIAKTFLDVHKTSLAQLNKYYRQPVQNQNILMAQRLADASGDEKVRLEAYKTTITSINGIIKVSGRT